MSKITGIHPDGLLILRAHLKGLDDLELETMKKALKESYNKWHNVAMNQQGDHGVSDCALCAEYLWFLSNKGNCLGCPVSIYTGKTHCDDSPYEKWVKHQETSHKKEDEIYEVKCPKCKKLAREEADFLNMLRNQVQMEIDSREEKKH